MASVYVGELLGNRSSVSRMEDLDPVCGADSGCLPFRWTRGISPNRGMVFNISRT